MEKSMSTTVYVPRLASMRVASRERIAHEQQEVAGNKPVFAICGVPDLPFKDDLATMEAAIFTLSTKKDLRVWRWTSTDGKKRVEVAPSIYGRATIHDKDVLIYLVSHLVAAFNRGEIPSRTVCFTGYHYLKTTGKNTWSDDYRRLKQTLDRLRGTTIKTDIKTGGRQITRSFGLIDSWQVIEDMHNESRTVAIQLTISEWLYNAIKANEILTINSAYFRLRKPLERRIYEIARKHVGKQGMWEISLDALRSKCGSTVERSRQFRAEVSKIAEADTLPDYRVAVIPKDKARFIARDTRQILNRLNKIPK